MSCGAAPKRSAMYGTSGIRMPNPSVSMMQKIKSAASRRGTFRHPSGLMAGDEGRDVDALGRGGGKEIARPANDEVGDASLIPPGVDGGRGPEDRDLQ